MNNRAIGGLMAASLLVSASAAMAQNVFTGTTQVDDQIEDLQDDIQDDFDRDTTYGNDGRPLGFSGSVALRGSTSAGNTDTTDLGIGSDLNWYDGTNGFELGLSYQYGDDNGVKTEESLLYDLEYNRDINPRMFGYATIQGSVDEFSSFDNDTFVGLGLGYRVISTPQTQWTVQAGPGYRFAQLDGGIDEINEAALGVESDFSHRLTDNLSLINDTNIVASDSDTSVINELGLTTSVSDQLALKTSLQTEYHSDPVGSAKNTDNTLGVALIYSFK